MTILKFKILFFCLVIPFLSFSQNANYEKYLEFFSNAQIQELNDNYDSAVVLYKSAIFYNPKSHASFYALGRIFYDKKNIKESVYYFEKCVELDPENLWYKRMLFSAYKIAGDYDSADKLVEEILIKTNYTDDFYEAFDLFLLTKDYNKIDSYSDIYFSKFSYDEKVFEYMFLSNFNNNDTTSFLKNVDLMFSVLPSSSFLFSLTSEYFKKFNLIKQQKAVLLNAFKNNYENFEIFVDLTEIYFKQNSADSAIFFLNLSIKNQNSNPELIANLISKNSFQILNQTVYNLDSLSNTLKFYFQNDFSINKSLGDIYFTKNDFYKSIEYYETAIEINKTDFQLYLNLFNIYSRFSLYKKLDSLTEEALYLYPLQPYIYLFKSIALLENNKLSDAEVFISQGLNITFDDNLLLAYFNFYMSQYFRLSNDSKNEDIFYQKAYNISQNNVDLLAYFAFYYSKKNIKTDIALKLVEQCISQTANPSNSLLYIYSYVLYITGNYEKSLTNIDIAIKNSKYPNFVFYELKGNILNKLNKVNEAQYFFDESVKLGNLYLNKNL